MYSLGVDLGTTSVAAATTHAGRPEMVTLGDRSVTMPATVAVDENGVLINGDAAARVAHHHPDRAARELKRHLGDPAPIRMAGAPHDTAPLLGELLRTVVDTVSATAGREPDAVVLTHPANWGPYRRGLFDEVATIAGLERARTVPEPMAAVAQYVASHELRDGDTLAVYDLGGGSFDATVMRVRGDDVEILGTPETVERLGGADFDEAVLAYVNRACGGALDELDPYDAASTAALDDLRRDCVRAKEALSTSTAVVVSVRVPGRNADVDLTRSDFEDMIREPLGSTVEALDRALSSAQVGRDELAVVLLVGGSTRIPLVVDTVAAELGRPTVADPDPEHTIARGAAILAANDRSRVGGEAAPGSGTAEMPAVEGADASVAPEDPSSGARRRRVPVVLGIVVVFVVALALGYVTARALAGF